MINITGLKTIPQKDIIGRNLGPILDIHEFGYAGIQFVFDKVVIVCEGGSSSGDGTLEVDFYERIE